MTSMDWIPTDQTIVYDGTGYDAFPSVAYSPTLGKAVAVWQHGAGHVADASTTTWASRWDEATDTWSTPAQILAAPGGGKIRTVPGICWSSTLGKFVIVVQTRSPWEASLMTSPDGITWTTLGGTIVFPWATWAFASDIIEYNGELYVSAYAKYASDGDLTSAAVVKSADGITWTDCGQVGGLATDHPGENMIEPRFAKTSFFNHLEVFIRTDAPSWQIRTSQYDPAENEWSTPKAALSGVTGQPAPYCITDFVWVTLFREYSRRGVAADKYHGSTGWAYTIDAGESWTMTNTDPTGTNRAPFMYGAITGITDGNLLAVVSVEDSLTPWGTAQIRAFKFENAPLTVEFRHDLGAPAVQITAPVPEVTRTVTRRWTHPVTGVELVEPVRYTAADGSAIDWEAPQGCEVTYETPSGASVTVDIPEWSSVWLVHPVLPDRSVPISIGEIDTAKAGIDSDTVYVPGRTDTDGINRAIVVNTSARHGWEGSFTARTHTLEDEANLLRILDGTPLYVNAHAGVNLPRWVHIPEVAKQQPVNYCGDHRRDWQLPFVEQARPSTYDMPVDLRIKDLDYTFAESTGTIRTGSPGLLRGY